MKGPQILARTMSIATTRGKSTRAWQYHSRSDSHSKIACWTVLFDLLLECDVMRRAAAEGRIGFGINHVMVGPINKTLDLVVTMTPETRNGGSRRRFGDLVNEYGILLDEQESALLEGLPVLFQDLETDISEIAIALEAKACMTEHVKSLPRLHAEILATGYLAKLAAPDCITVSYSLVNAAKSFLSPAGQGGTTQHKQPQDARRVLDMIAKAVPTVFASKQYGYDVVGVTTLVCANDGSPVSISADPAVAPTHSDVLHYERMIRGICSAYRGRFAR